MSVQPPASPRYRMPAEWERHDSTWVAWPKDPLTFPEDVIGRVEEVYEKMVSALSSGERVNVLVDDDKMERRVSSLIGPSTRVRYHRIRTADVWTRDYGPIFVRQRDGKSAATKWVFNAWGNKYEELLRDNDAGIAIARAAGTAVVETGMVLEGGSIDSNGLGTCLTTEQCLLNPNRNPGMSKQQIERKLERYLGFTNLVWLKQGIAGDDTDGHIDDIARFVGEGKVICMVEDDPSDENYGPLRGDLELLEAARDERGRELDVIPVSMPRRKVGGRERLPASYANFFVGNSSVLVPTFDDANDDPALSTIASAFPGRKVVGIDCRALVYGFGSIHCVTQQQPSPAV